MIELRAAVIEAAKRDRFTVIVPEFARDAWQVMQQDKRYQQSNQLAVTFGPPKRPRTTGEKSQNHAIHGYATQIGVFTGDYKEDVIREAKRRAVTHGYPTHEDSFGNIVPDSEKGISTVEAGYLIDELKVIASYVDLTLREM